MKNLHRFACIVSAVPLLFYVYACSSSNGGGDTPDDDAGSSGSSGTSSGSSGTSSGSSGTSSGSSGIVDSGTDSSDGAVSTICVGNPFLASPDASTPDGGVTADASGLSQIVPSENNGNFLDGPQWVDQDGGAGFLVFSEFQPTERLRKVSPDGGGLVDFRTTGITATEQPTGNAYRSGTILTALGAAPDTPSEIITTFLDGGAGPTLSLPSNTGATGVSSPNDLAVNSNGIVYFTAPGFQSSIGGLGIYQTGTDGGAPTLITATGTDEPNGIAISPDGTKLYVSITNAATKRVDSYAIPASGIIPTNPTATNVVPTALLTDDPDGLAVDNAGNLYVAEANDDSGTISGEVEVFTPAGKKLGKIPFPSARPTNVAFGGANKQLLFITVEDGVYVYSGRCAGLP